MEPISRSAVSLVAFALHQLGRLAGPLPGARILYYHSISNDPVRSSVSPEVFAAHIDYLRGRCEPVSLSEVVRRLAGGAPLAPRTVVITFDDGFRDNYEQAFPILARAGIPATVFLTASFIGTQSLPTLSRTEFVPRPLDWGQVREMHAHGIEFGSHTLTHPMLSQVPLDDARREIAESRRMIEDKLGVPPPFFCYPRGDFNEAVKRMVKEEGYLAACTTLPGTNDRKADLFALRRTYIGRRDTPREFAKKMAGGYDLLQKGIRLWRRLRPR
jgi:peptidoglycan/xylan/chitin deacetylase (PgdA/CDA1 family)